MSQYDSDIHHRQTNRLRGWEYTAPAAYFITICTHGREALFDHVAFREIAENAWLAIPTQPRAAAVALDEYVVMPDHVHGILMINDVSGEGDVPQTGRGALGVGLARGPAIGSRVPSPLRCGPIGAIVGNYKSWVARRINTLRGAPGEKVWQRGYYDHIVRNDQEMDAVRRPIRGNPTRMGP